MKQVEEGELSDAFWNNLLVSNLESSSTINPSFSVFIMAQIKNNARGFLSEHIIVKSLVEEKGDIHHIFPKNYLKKNGINNRSMYNQVANYVYTQSEINIRIKDKAPNIYMKEVLNQINKGEAYYGSIGSKDDLKLNLYENAIPEEFVEMDVENYLDFLDKRRRLMSQYIKDFYFSL